MIIEMISALSLILSINLKSSKFSKIPNPDDIIYGRIITYLNKLSFAKAMSEDERIVPAPLEQRLYESFYCYIADSRHRDMLLREILAKNNGLLRARVCLEIYDVTLLLVNDHATANYHKAFKRFSSRIANLSSDGNDHLGPIENLFPTDDSLRNYLGYLITTVKPKLDELRI